VVTRGRPREFDRAEALHTAMTVFWQHGYEGTSISHLTEAMGISAPSLYAAFGSKESLFYEAVELYEATEGRNTNDAFDAPTAREAVEAMLRNNVEAYTDPATPPGCMLVLAATTGTTGTQGVRDFLAEQRKRSERELRGRLRRAVREGELSRDTDVRAVAAFYTTVLQGLSIQARDGAPRSSLNAIVDSALSAWPESR
jgi:AcrR family transcriptional regulator